MQKTATTSWFGYSLLGLVVAALLLSSTTLVRAEGDVVTPDGENGANAGQEVVATSTEAQDGTGGQSNDVGGTIITGDATASTSVENTLNTNDVDPDTACDPGACTNSSTITATSTNEAIASTTASTSALTGENEVQGGGTATIVTGNAIAFANVINLINTNIFNSIGLIKFVNQIFGTGLDLRDYDLSYFFDGDAGSSPVEDPDTGEPQCTLLTCLNSSELNVLSTNTATVTNSVIVRAGTGDNLASTSEDGDAEIDTGDAYAAANVVNLVNTNIVNSSYLLVAFNNFGDLVGDITLPGGTFFTDLFARGGSVPAMNSSTYEVYNDNLGTTTTDIVTDADTGNNLASTTGEGSGVITTGNAYSQATEFTDHNKNYVGGTSAFFMFRVAGEWTGNFKSLPAGLTPYKMYDVATKDGIVSTSTLVLISSEEAMEHAEDGLQDADGMPSANCDGPNSPDNPEGTPINNCYNSSGFLASSSNTVAVDNNIDVSASTGSSTALTEDGTAHIITGDAYAIANVVNLINTNIVGRNWIFALFNVLGNWEGDITFGKSDLLLAATTNASGPILPGSMVDYTFTITNNGDRDADDIVLQAKFNEDHVAFTDTEGESVDGGREWRLPSVRRGETETFTFPAQVGNVPAGTAVTVPMSVTAQSDGNDTEAAASFTLALVDVVSPPSGGGGGGGGGGSSKKLKTSKFAIPETSTFNPDLSVVKEVTRIGTTTPTTVDYKVVVTNTKNGGALYDGKLIDTLYNPAGEVMYTRDWDIGAMAAGEQITLTYTVEFGTSTVPGTYRNVAEITGKRLGSGVDGKPFAPVQGVGTVTFGGSGLVLGAAADCSLAVAQNLSRGMINPEVAKLQRFLNTQGATLPGTNFFGPQTFAAVTAFQAKFAGEILAPSGLTRPTGYVGPMTIKKIRDLSCATAASTPAATAAPLQ